jgi:hypothetical protein
MSKKKNIAGVARTAYLVLAEILLKVALKHKKMKKSNQRGNENQ